MVAGTRGRTPREREGIARGSAFPSVPDDANVRTVTDLKLTPTERADIVAYLARVVPRGQVEADHLHRLITLLDTGRRIR